MKFVTSAVCLVLVFAATASAQSNRCFSAGPIFNGLTNGTNVGSDLVGSDPTAPACGFIGTTVWYSYTATCNGTVTVQTCAPGAANFDTQLEAYDGSCGCNAMTLLACNDDTCALQSQISFNATSGGNYFICVGGFASATGNFTLSVSCTGGAPNNDNCAAAYNLPIARTITGTNVGSTNSGAPGCAILSDVWYTFTAPVSGNCTVSTCNSVIGSAITNYDTYLGVFTGGCGALAVVPGACNDDNCGTLQSLITFGASAGTQYWVNVGGFNGIQGRFGLKVSFENQVNLSFWDQGPGTVGFRVSDTGGNYYFFVTTSGLNYPNAWFYGINMTWNDVIAQATGGFPFQGPMTGCGTVGAFGPLPAGLTVYAVAMSVPGVGGSVNAVSAPTTFTTY